MPTVCWKLDISEQSRAMLKFIIEEVVDSQRIPWDQGDSVCDDDFFEIAVQPQMSGGTDWMVGIWGGHPMHAPGFP